jgi:hypothetical protein
MAQHLADLGQAPAGAQHLSRGRVPQAMGAHGRQPGSPAGTAHDLGDGARRQAAVRRAQAREHERRPAARAPARKPTGQRLTDVAGDGHSLLQQHVTTLRIRW